ncbi:Protein of unknown function [Pyronema omphalodes CBS 100304]|uniref:Uncharacterized protein n=1 Tax=Pyronema omphalodes (strain CBS 100304) TaxID=1076935 RepID=U4L0M2_PYROM|nr:Protein of unknown function [Pyronema omphalodes CBS 100304]
MLLTPVASINQRRLRYLASLPNPKPCQPCSLTQHVTHRLPSRSLVHSPPIPPPPFSDVRTSVPKRAPSFCPQF